MGYVEGDYELPFPKTDRLAVPATADPAKHVTAANWNAVCQAIEDIKTYVLSLSTESSTTNLWNNDDGTAGSIDLVDDMFYVGPMYTTFTGTSGTPVGWHTLTMQGTARLLGLTGTGRQGLVSLQCGETEDGYCRLHTIAAGAFDDGGQANLSSLSYECVLAVETLSTGTEEFMVEAGLVGNAPGYGAHFRYQRTVGGAKWIAVTEDNATETAVVLDGTTQGGVATVDAGNITAYSLPNSGFFRLKVVIESSDGTHTNAEAKFYVNGTLVATLDTNMPSHSLAGSINIIKSAGTTNRSLAVDYARLRYVYRSARTP